MCDCGAKTANTTCAYWCTTQKVNSCEHAEHEGCGGSIHLRGAMTRYAFDGVPNSLEDPNRDLLLCENHWKEYESHWNDMWDGYYAGLLS